MRGGGGKPWVCMNLSCLVRCSTLPSPQDWNLHCGPLETPVHFKQFLFFSWILICVPSWTVLRFGKFSRKPLLFIGLCLAENWFHKLSKNWKLQIKLLCLAIPWRFLITRKYGESLKFFVEGTALLLNFLSIKHDMTVHFFVSTHFWRCTTPLARNSRTCNIYLGGCWHSFLCSLQSYQESWQVCKGIWLLEVCEVTILDHYGE